MSEYKHHKEETKRQRDTHSLGLACSSCGISPVYEDDGLGHYYHRKGCPIPERVRVLIEESKAS